MTEASLIPQSYDQWRDCITVGCGIPLTRTYMETRLAELRDVTQPRTREFRDKFGVEHFQRIIEWFELARQEAT